MSVRRAAVVMVRGYQYVISPMLGHNCRFFPTCSEYTCQAIERYGIAKGSWLALNASAAAIPGTPVVLIPFLKRPGAPWIIRRPSSPLHLP